MLKPPLDPTPYPKHKRSRPIDQTVPDGGDVYVQDAAGVIWVLEDRPHRHVRVLGGGESAMYAGDLTVEHGRIKDGTNLSGAFQFDEPAGLIAVAETLESLGLKVETGAARFFPMDGSPPLVLR